MHKLVVIVSLFQLLLLERVLKWKALVIRPNINNKRKSRVWFEINGIWIFGRN